MIRRSWLRAWGVGVALLTSVSGSGAAQEVLKLGHVLAPTHQFHRGMELAAKELQAKTGGRVTMQVFPSSQLGTERDMNVGVRSGTVDMVLASPGGASVHLRDIAVLDAPYLFRDDAHWRKVVYGEIGDDWTKRAAETSNVHFVGWFHRGTRHVISKTKPYATLADMRGQKIRVADFPPYPQVFRALGAVPTPIAFAEMYSALESGIVDGADVPLDTIPAMKLHEVTKFVNLVAWSYAAPGVIVMSDAAMKRVPAADRAAVRAAIRVGTDYIATEFETSEKSVREQIAKAGMTLVEPKDPEAWRKVAAEQAIPELARTWGGDAGLYKRIAETR
ncbi:MAG: TRAP transporter substrate-binding protein [Alphaproteobacteria bacterium]|nr:TRAP transporter substrate-binding protein [Alphaproteobacteria bacterium]